MNQNKTIAIIGRGYVGQALIRFFENRKDIYNIISLDIQDNDFEEKKQKAANADLICLAVPTPMNKDGSCDLTAIEFTMDWIAEKKEEFHHSLILIKSTILPGTTKNLNQKYNEKGMEVVFSPEYIGEGKYFIPEWKYPHPTEMIKHNFQIFGGNKLYTSKIIQFFLPILGPECHYYQTDSTTAELCKYMENSWGAMKVSFCNEWYEIARIFGVNYEELRELWLADSRVERMHTAVFENKRGFGGKCYPKDVYAFVKACEINQYEPKILKQILKSNEEFTAKN